MRVWVTVEVDWPVEAASETLDAEKLFWMVHNANVEQIVGWRAPRLEAMTPEQIERLKALCRNPFDARYAEDLRALLADWEEQGREIERLKHTFSTDDYRRVDDMAQIARLTARVANVVEALKVAREYVKATEGQLVTRPNVVTKDRELCDAALAAAQTEEESSRERHLQFERADRNW